MKKRILKASGVTRPPQRPRQLNLRKGLTQQFHVWLRCRVLRTVVALKEVIKSPRVVLTHISHQFDEWMMDNPLPDGFEAGFDGQEITLA